VLVIKHKERLAEEGRSAGRDKEHQMISLHVIYILFTTSLLPILIPIVVNFELRDEVLFWRWGWG
jgi:uncharacterized membrane protein